MDKAKKLWLHGSLWLLLFISIGFFLTFIFSIGVGYTAEDLESAKDEYDVVFVEFYSDGCYVCKIIEPVIEEIAEENPDIKVMRIDVNAVDVTKEYDVQYVPTVVIYARGEEVWRLVGKSGSAENTKKIYEGGINLAKEQCR